MLTLNCIGQPDPSAGQEIRQIMEELSQKTGSTKALRFAPHFTIRNDFKIKEEDLPALQEDLDRFLNSYSPLQLELPGYGFYPWKVVYLKIKPHKDLQEIHDRAMRIIQKYRRPWVAEFLLKSPHFHGKQRQYLEEYGYQFCFEYYSPHFTVCGNDMDEEIFQEVKTKLRQIDFSMPITVSRIICLDRDSNNRALLEFDLSES